MQIFSVTGAPGTVNNKVLSPFYDGEGFDILLEVRDRMRQPITDLTGYDVFITLSNNPGGSPPGTPNIIEYHRGDPQAVALPDKPGTVRFRFRAAALNVLDEGLTYHYNIWSRAPDMDPDVQAVGSLTPILSIRAARESGLPILAPNQTLMTFDDGTFVTFGDGAFYIQEDAI